MTGDYLFRAGPEDLGSQVGPFQDPHRACPTIEFQLITGPDACCRITECHNAGYAVFTSDNGSVRQCATLIGETARDLGKRWRPAGRRSFTNKDLTRLDVVNPVSPEQYPGSTLCPALTGGHAFQCGRCTIFLESF